MSKHKKCLGLILFTLILLFIASCKNTNKSSTPSGTILNTIDIGGTAGILPGLPPKRITYNDVDNSIWVVAENTSPSGISYVVKFDINGNFITYTAVGHEATGIVSDKQGNVWVSVANDDKVMELDPNGKIINQFNVGTRPWYINTDPAGNIWVLNIGPLCPGTCGPPTYVASFTEVTTKGNVIAGYSFSTPFEGPFIFDRSGNIWVANGYTNYPITEMNPNGAVIKTIYGNTAAFPTSIFGENMIFDNYGNLWLVNSRASDGTNSYFVTKVYTTNKAPESYSSGGMYPWSIAVDHNDNIWVTGIFSNTVSKINNSGEIIGVYRFDQFQQLSYPTGPVSITVDKNNNIWFTDDRQDGYVIELAP